MPEGAAPAAKAAQGGQNAYKNKSKPQEVRMSNIAAAKAVADAIRTSLGPRGMDKMIANHLGDVTITNDGATILQLIQVLHPAAKMLVELSKAQDVEAGDGTTSVVVICGALLGAAERLLSRGIHPTVISDAFQVAAQKAVEILESVSTAISLDDREALLKAASTSLNSKVVSLYSDTIAPIVVDAVMAVCNKEAGSVDLNDIKLIQKLDGTVEDTELVDGVVFDKRISHVAGGLDRMENPKIALIQFCLSPPKTDMDNSVVISDFSQMDRAIREERQYILGMVKKIKKSGCNVLLVQKSILRDAINDLAQHFLAKMKIIVVKGVERDDVEYLCKSLGCRPIANIDDFTPDKFGQADLLEEVSAGTTKMIKITGAKRTEPTCSVIVRGSSELVLAEAERSIHDALCVVRCLVKKRAVISGGGVPEIEVALQLAEHAKTLVGMEAYCIKEFADALEVVPFTLAENAGLNPIDTVTELRAKHKAGQKDAGINVRKGTITDIRDENVLQPLLVSTSAISLAAETVRSILKIDDIVNTR